MVFSDAKHLHDAACEAVTVMVSPNILDAAWSANVETLVIVGDAEHPHDAACEAVAVGWND